MFTARSGHGMISVEGNLYVCGGYNGNREATNPEGQLRCLVSVEQYSVKDNQWTKLSAMTFGICFFEMTGRSYNIHISLLLYQLDRFLSFKSSKGHYLYSFDVIS